MRRVSRWLALDRRSGRGAGLPTVEVVAAEDYNREVNDLRDQVQMYEEKAERDWRDFGEMQDARIAADDRVVELEKELARVCKQLDSANDMVERAWSLIAGAMSGNPHRPTANTEWMDAAHAWEHDYCMGQGTLAAAPASPDERLREALARANDDLIVIADDAPEGVGEAIDSVRAAIKDALAAGRAAAHPDPPGRIHRGDCAGFAEEGGMCDCNTDPDRDDPTWPVPAASPDERLREAGDLTAAGDGLQSAASRLAEWVRDQDAPYEVALAASEAQSFVENWTAARLAAADREAPDECPHLSCTGDGEVLVCNACGQVVPSVSDDPKETTPDA